MKISRAEKIGVVGFLLMAFFASAMDSDNILIPAAGLIVSCLMMGGSAWLYCRR